MTDNTHYLKAVETKLRSARVLSPRVEAELLLTHFGRLDRLDLFTGKKKITPSARRSIEKALAVRKKGRPLSHLTGRAPFYGRMFRVTKDTLIPRPETEVLVEEALALLKADFDDQAPQILDVGTGSGCIAVCLTLEYPACRMTALDASFKALKVARKNVELFGLNDQIQLVKSRLFASFGKEKYGFWDVLVSNPPYVPAEDWTRLSREVRSEPRLALDGGPRGLRVIERLLEQAPVFLKPGGWLLVEIGKGQSAILRKSLKKNSLFKNLKFIKDLNGIDRVLVAQIIGHPRAGGDQAA